MKVCSKCGVCKDFDQFSKCSKHADGLSYMCKICSYEYIKKYRIEKSQKVKNKRNETLRMKRAGTYDKQKIKQEIAEKQQNHRQYCENNKNTLMKKCNKCLVDKFLSDFDKAAKETDGFQYTCKQCNREWAKKYRSENEKKEYERHRKYHIENKENINKRISNWQKNNPEKRQASSKRFYANNTEREKIRMKKWSENNKYWLANYSSKQRLIRKQAFVKWANEKKILEIYAECERITKETGILHHVDHIIPIKSKYICGLHVENNLRIITAVENCKKHNKFRPHITY